MGGGRGWSLRARLTALLLATLIPLAGLAAFWIVGEARNERADAEREARGVAEYVAARAERLVAGTHETLAVLARLPAVRGRNRKEADRLFRDLSVASPRLENIFAFTADGALVASGVPVAPGVRIPVRDRPWFQAVIRSGRPVVGGFQVGRITGKPVVVLAHPIVDGRGRVLGVVGAALRLAQGSREISPVQTGPETSWAVVDGDGLLLLHGDPTAPLGKPLAPVAGMLQAETVVPGTPWRAVVRIPEAMRAARVRSEVLEIGLPTLLVLLGATGVGFWIARRTWQPLRGLAAAVRRIGAGEAGIRIPVKAGGEVGEVATALSEALETLAAREANLTRRNRELSALLRALKALYGHEDLESLLPTLVEEARNLGGARYGALALLGPDGRIAGFHTAGLSPEDVARISGPPMGRGVLGLVLRSAAPVRVDDLTVHPEAAGVPPGHPPMRTFLGVPIIVEGKTAGSLYLTEKEGGVSFSPEDERVLSAFGEVAALAMARATLLAERQRRAGDLATLLETARLVSGSLSLPAVLKTLAEATCRHLGVRMAGISVLEPDGRLPFAATIGLSEHYLSRVNIRLGDGGLIGWVAEHGEPLAVADVPADPRTRYPEVVRGEGLVSFLGVPLMARDRVTGVLSVMTDAPREFGPEEIAILETLAQHGALALENARLFQQEQERRRQVEAVRALGAEITRELDLATLLGLITRRAAELAGAVSGAIYLWDEAAQVLWPRAWYGLGEWMAKVSLRLGEGITGSVAERREGLLVNDYRSSPYAHPLFLERTGITGTVAEPLLHHDRLIGVITINNEGTARPFTERDRELLSLFATQAAIAIENARLYEVIRQHAAELEARVRDRTAELEKALQVKAQFLANMSHELRTPLNFILGFAQLLQQGTGGPLAPKQADYVDRILKGGKRLLELVSDILHLSLIDAGRAALSLKPVPLAPLVQEVLDLFRVQADQKALELTTALDPSLPIVVADRAKLTQLLANLVGNAVKFTPDGGRITVTAGRLGSQEAQASRASQPPSVPAEAWVELAVEDTGIGIKPEDRERIFVPFHQVDASDTREYGGAGIGLSLVRKLAELHGGRVWAESAGLGQGARFVVRLPLLEAPRPTRILLVEDEVSVRDALCTALRSAGHAVEPAATGSQALTALTATPPDLLVLDIGLPDMDGWAVLKQVRGTEATRALPVLVLTGLEHVQAEQALALGADDFLAKPVSARVLLDTVARLLARPGTASAARERESPIIDGSGRIYG